MIRIADKDGDGTISEKEFMIVMRGAGSKKDNEDKKGMMQKMRLNLKSYINNKKNEMLFKEMKPEIKWILNTIKEQNDDYKMNNKKEKPSEDVSEANKSVMDDVWELL